MDYNVYRDFYNLFSREYGLLDMTLHQTLGEEDFAEVRITGDGMARLVADLMRAKAHIDLVDGDGGGLPPKEEIKCTFDEVMNFRTGEKP